MGKYKLKLSSCPRQYSIKDSKITSNNLILPDFKTYSAFSATRLSNWPTDSFGPVERSRLHVLPTSTRPAIPALDQSLTQERMTLSVVVRLGRVLGPHRAPGAGPESSRQGEGLARILRGLRPGRALRPIVRTLLALHHTGANIEIWSG
ncbi:protein of unknown function [Methylorubrum extorquens]|uniref:Uncharacterized protein n=1 Tax=Methylorubrum extorquens TaxID=408 RepID=A0A2N9AIC3_METEX|nr:protein of unknown function [Methylorubrum extorquens]